MKKCICSLFLTMFFSLGLCIIHSSAISSTTLTINAKTATLGLGEVYSFSAKTNSQKTVIWSSDDKNIASVSKGIVEAQAEGKTIIRASVDDVIAEIKITVKPAPKTIKADNVTVSVGETETIKLYATKGSASKTKSYKSANTKIARVSSSGKITGIKEGKTTITVTSFNGKTATLNVTVTKAEPKYYEANGSPKENDGWIYYNSSPSSKNNKYTLFKMKMDGTGIKKLLVVDDEPTTFCISDDWIYYVRKTFVDECAAYTMSVWRMKTDGTKKHEIISSVGSNGFFATGLYGVCGDTIYYEFDGTYKATISDDGFIHDSIPSPSVELGVSNGWAYSMDYSADNYHSLTKTSIDEKTEKVVHRFEKLEQPQEFGSTQYYGLTKLYGPNIYFNICKHEGFNDLFKLYKIDTDGKNLKLITEGVGKNTFVIKDDWIYYSITDYIPYSTNEPLKSFEGFSYIYKIKTNGSMKTLVYKSEDKIMRIEAVIGDWIFFEDNSSPLATYRIKSDGTGKVEL